MNLVLIRILLLGVFAALTTVMVSLFTGARLSLALTPQLSALYFIPANLICLWLLVRSGKFGSALGKRPFFRPSDVGTGFIWLFVLFFPFAAAINLVMLLLYGPRGMIAGFETIFVPAAGAEIALSGPVALISAILVAVLFPVTNAPVEELYYRGHAQRQLNERGLSLPLAILIQAALFGVQHVFLAPTPAAALVYLTAFFAWGAVAGVIYARQRRLAPLIIAHFLTNAMTAVVPLVFIIVGVPDAVSS